MSKLQRVLLWSGLVIIALAGIGVFGHLSSSQRSLGAYKAELLRQGEKLTYAALTVPRSTNANRSLGVLTNAAARLSSARINVSWLNLRTYVGPGQARVRCLDEGPAADSRYGSSLSFWENLSNQLATVEIPLAEIREAMKDPQPDWDVGTNVLKGLPNFIAIRTAAQWLSAASLWDMHQGKVEAGLEDLEAIVGVARLNREEYTLVAQMIRIAVANLGLCATWEALQVPGWTDPQLRRLQSAWEHVDLVEALEKGMLGERAMGEELWTRLRQPNGLQVVSTLFALPLLGAPNATNSLGVLFSRHVLFPIYRMTSIDEDELLYLRTMQGSLDALRALNAGGSWPAASRDLDKTYGALLRMTSSPQRFRYPFSSIAIPNFLKAVDNGVRSETERQLVLAAIALKRFQSAHSAFPETLAALVPDCLPGVPRDPMSGKSLHYQLRPGQAPLLYSVGTDGEDNGGDATSAQTNKFGLWEGRDAVWPAPTMGSK